MKYMFDDYNWLLRLDKGELLIQALTRFVKDQDITGAWIQGLGGATWAELAFYDLDTKEYHYRKLDMFLEIASLQGNIAWEGAEPLLHLHGTFSDQEMNGYAGHVRELEVAGTCELMLHCWYKGRLTRTFLGETGLKQLDI